MASGHRGLVRKRTGWLFVIFSLLYLAMAGRLVQVQLLDSERYHKWADRLRHRKIVMSASRGGIYDRHGQPLAISIQTASVYANRNEIEDASRTAVQVAAVIGAEARTLEDRINDADSSIVWLGRQLDPRIGDKVADMRTDLPGVGIKQDSKRVYPAGPLAAQILGFTNFYGDGLEGLEAVLDDVLRGTDGVLQAELDAERRVIPETRHVVREPRNGKDIRLTIDVGIQHIAEQALARMADDFHPQNACAIVMDPHTGEILALANYPTFDPNKPRSVDKTWWRNRAVADLYEPGSTLKAVTVAAALNEGISPYEVVAHCTGCESMNGGRIRCSLHYPYLMGHGGVDLYKMIQQSCNIAAAHVAARLGAQKLHDYEEAFGLFDKPNAGFGCEAVGKMLPPSQWRPIRLANVGFGQGIAVTPLQMAAVYATIANGGVYVEPQIIREVRNPDGSIYKPFRIGRTRRVASRKVASTTVKMLASCVQMGTGKNSKIVGRTVAGKTGSAQIAKPTGGYERNAYAASFIGFTPVRSPRLVIAVVVNRPQKSHFGAVVASPVFREIGEKALWYLKVPSDAPPGKNRIRHREGTREGLA